MEDQQSRFTDAGPGLIAGLAGMTKNMFGLLISRIELAALELSEVRTSLLRILLICALGIVAAWFAIAYWSVLIVVLAWPSLGWKILLILAAAFTLLAIAIFLYAQSMLNEGKLSMPATMAELRNDRDALL
ncbi:MAG: hypothetical protein JWQ21_71 [Herminiimonas sp.]|nr:hypothetical protein [Herminiimonas sp.]